MALLSKGVNIIKNISGSSYLLEIDKLCTKYQYVVVILDNNHQLDNIAYELNCIIKDKKILKFPSHENEYYETSPVNQEIIKNRLNCLIDLDQKKQTKKIILTTYKSIFNKIPDLKNTHSSWSLIHKKTKYEDILATLKKYNYTKVSKIEESGQYRQSGSIIDFFSVVNDRPIRLNFYGDVIETLKEFNLITQLTENEVESTYIGTTGLYHLTNENIENYKKYISNSFNDEYKDDLEYENIVNHYDNSSIQNLIPSFYQETFSFLSLIKNSFACFIEKDIIDEFNHQNETMKNIYNIESKLRYILKPKDLLINMPTIEKIVSNNYFYLASDNVDGKNSIKSAYTPLPPVNINYNYKNPFTNFENLLNTSSYNFILLIKRDDNFKTITNYLISKKIDYIEGENIENTEKKIQIIRSDISQGFIDNSSKQIYISSNDLFGLIKTRINKNKTIKSIIIDKLTDLKINELIVHQEHGIGRYKGLITMDIENKTVELIKIEYADNNNLYIPITSISLIQKYIGNVSLNTKLATLGTDRWIKIKQRAKKKIEDIAANLLLVQAKRALNKGFKYEFNINSYEKFCKMFPYIETDDQLDCINEVISDMCSSKTMDRVVCGDVGFGKTEVILRAAHIAVSNSKQVIILVPTTILAKQHYQTFKTRFSNYKINISLLTRVVSTADKKDTLENINNGKINILIGTHALLNKNITYHNLGLLIIDEEHKFGVKHKEVIKTIKEEIDVLSLTATPIPRTLNAALSEIKDMSIINTAPIGRKNIETNIINKSKNDLYKYINREINRGGQILFIHNNIESMDEEINLLKEIDSNYRVEKVHGRLKNNDIENIMNRFMNEEIDILVCTSIVESGLDMTNVNTIIINDAQNFGLSQLHQIRGRVGRSARQAYAGLILCDAKKMTKEAHRRVDAFIKTDSLAGGLDIAGHDLDIRGAGEILGEEQSGQILEIGYGMYTSMLSKAINQLKNNKEITNKQHVEVDAYISTLIPQEYIEDIFLRLEYYSEISNVVNEHELNQITSKLLDIYGPIPEYLNNLMNLTRVRIFANSINAEKIKINRDNTVISLNKNSHIDHDQLVNKYVLSGKIKLLDECNLKYLNNKDHDFSTICNDIISMIRLISSH